MKHGKNRAPRKPSAHKAKNLRFDENRVRTRIRELRDASGSNRAFAALVFGNEEEERLVRAWVGQNLGKKQSKPASANLFQIGLETGVSIDWLLGFDDVPRMRGQRALVADLARALTEHVASACPSALALGGYVRKISRTTQTQADSVRIQFRRSDFETLVSGIEGTNVLKLSKLEPLKDAKLKRRRQAPASRPETAQRDLELVVEPDAQQRLLSDVVRWIKGRRRVVDVAASLDAASAWPTSKADTDWVHMNKAIARSFVLRAAADQVNSEAVVRIIDMSTGAHIDWPTKRL